MKTAPYGTWRSPLPAAAVAAGGLRLSAVQLDGDAVYWLEGRPQEGGRCALVRWQPGRLAEEITPPDFNVRSRVHEYGGGACLVRGGDAYCVHFADQRVYRLTAGGAPVPLTPSGRARYADFELDAARQRLICVREDHAQEGREPVNTLVSIPLDSRIAPVVLASGYDFYSTPRLSPDGRTLAWLSWRHPGMPWDGTELWVAGVDETGALAGAIRVAGSESESIYQPGWAPDGTLCYVSDREGWWTIYRADRAGGADRALVRHAPADAEFGRPQWVFGTSTWAWAGASTLVVSYTRLGRWHLGTVDVATGILTRVATDLQPHDWIAADATHAALVAGSATAPDAVVRLHLATGAVETIQSASRLEIESTFVATAEPIAFPTGGWLTAHAVYYAPRNPGVAAPPEEKPPLVVITHGGPTASARPTLDLAIQYWTTRGFAVVDVNYGGSSGYGRAYRERLNGRWGVVDVEDVIHAARYLCDAGRADPARLIIRGGSAGGYTTLAALTFHAGVFKAGASYFGISDLEVLEIDTHKFESRYSHSLIGPYPDARDLYRARSPIHAIDRLACPLILFQGLEDKVVPPNQSQMMADAARAKGLPVAYLAFEGEQHGFRRAETIIRSLEAELYFYGKVFGFTPADPLAPVRIDNL